MAKKLWVTRQAVSRWENGETLPNTETLTLISKEFNVSINTLLGLPRKLICQCCGMPLNDDVISREVDGSLNEEYCKWCYVDGQFAYRSMQELMDFLVPHLVSMNGRDAQQVQSMLEKKLPALDHWKQG